MAYREPLSTFGASVFPGRVGQMQMPLAVLPGPDLASASGGPRRQTNGFFGINAEPPRVAEPLPFMLPPGTDVHVGMGGLGCGMNGLGCGCSRGMGGLDPTYDFLYTDASPEVQAMIDEYRRDQSTRDQIISDEQVSVDADYDTSYLKGHQSKAGGFQPWHVVTPWSMLLPKKAGGLMGLGDSSSNLQLVLAAAQAVHADIASGRTLIRVDADLQAAKGYLESLTNTSEYPTGAVAVANAQRDRDSFESRQSAASSASSGFDSATGAQQSFFAAGGKPINTGSGSVFADTVDGTIADISGGGGAVGDGIKKWFEANIPGFGPSADLSWLKWVGLGAVALVASPYVVPPVAKAVKGAFA